MLFRLSDEVGDKRVCVEYAVVEENSFFGLKRRLDKKVHFFVKLKQVSLMLVESTVNSVFKIH